MEILSFLWKDELWLPQNVTWKQIEKEGNYPNPYDLLYCFPWAIAIVIIRLLIERIVFVQLGIIWGLDRKKIEKNAVLERAFASSNTSENEIKKLSSELNWPELKIRTWFCRRNKMLKISKKFNEAGWRATFYLIKSLYGLICLWNVVSDDIRNYYLIELGFYVSLVITQFIDVKRKDFWQMFVHHIATILLLSLSWISNCVRIGSLVIICHDISGTPLQSMKLFGYLKMKRCWDLALFIFFITWNVSRLIIYPFVILKSFYYNAHQIIGPIFFCLIFGLLTLLLCLNLVWTWMILRLIQTSYNGKRKDLRSDSEELSEEEKKTI